MKVSGLLEQKSKKVVESITTFNKNILTTGTGEMMSLKVSVEKFGLTAQFMKANTKTVTETETFASYIRTETTTKVH